ncbi:hypothetical protein [Streptomyces sp. L2]|uniref:hypothetical protein n=1 Tax=Streptomyces sp. L2 TaxID=2162665 RepID=UPI001010711C|nr:hypothetical protein [Streptomyces sp. L2]
MSGRDDAAAREQAGEKSSPLGVDATPAERRWTLRGLVLLPLLLVTSGALAALAAFTASAFFDGTTRWVVWAAVASAGVLGGGYVAHILTDTLNSRKDGRP